MFKIRFLFLFFLPISAMAQQAVVSGIVTDSIGAPISGITISINQSGNIAITNEAGKYTLRIPADKNVTLAFSYFGKPSRLINIPAQLEGEIYQLNVRMQYGVQLKEFTITEERDREKVSMQTIDPKTVRTLPNPSGSFEAILKTLPGVSSNNELSSQYNVRGGNFDENLIYVNDIEIYRPFLPRAGQQEGLSFIHTEMVQSVKFSAGGFEARYGDRMSSVLDIKYRDPKKFAASANVSFMGVQAHVEDASKNKRFTYLLGSRYWTNQLVVSSLDTRGDYQPSFADVQTLITYHISDNLSISALGSYAQNRYLVVPEERETVFGTVQSALRLRMFFNGSDLMEYRTGIGALSLNYRPTHKLQLKFYSSAYFSDEREFFTVEGAYRLEEVETDFGSENFGRSRASKGVGYFLNNARNILQANVFNAGHRGFYDVGNHNMQWGAQVQGEWIADRLNEWEFIDSLGYAKNGFVDGQIVLPEYINAQNSISSYRISAYAQNSQILSKAYNMILNYGLRTNYWSYNEQNVVSPRIQFAFEPNRPHNRAVGFGEKEGVRKKDIMLKAAFGVYYQPPFYREFRDFSGNVNPNIRAQRSIHYIAGGDMNIKIWDRPFKLFGEAYYKQLDNLIPYELNNVRVRYYADNSADGYAAGIDMRLNGEFVPGTESWFTLSVLKTEERIKDAIITNHVTGERLEPGFVRRPTDQRVNMSVMFQDYMPSFPTYRVYLNLVYGTGLPFGPPDRNRYGDTLQMPSYRRIDIGFLKSIVEEDGKDKTGWKRHFTSMLLGVELFNMFDINNTISYLWIQDVESRTWAVPNYLTARRLNVRLIIKI
jgi:hypothetical protein